MKNINGKTQEEHRKSSCKKIHLKWKLLSLVPSLVPWPLLFFVLGFVFSIIHGSGRAVKNFHHSSASMYYTERKPKNEEQKRGGLGTRLPCPQAPPKGLVTLV